MSAETLLSVGIDLGTTTTQLVFSRLTVRNEGSAFSVPNYTVAAREVLRRSAVHFTPLRSERELDAGAIARIVDAEYAAAGIDRRAVQTGAVIITGETARRENARAVLEALSGYAGDFVVATAGPALESALAGRGAGAADYSQAHACTVVNLDIGGGTTDIGVLTMNGIAQSASLKVAGAAFDEAIIRHLRRRYGLLIGTTVAEEIKMSIGCVTPRPEALTMTVKGRDLKNGLAREATLTSEELMEVLRRLARQIMDKVLDVLESTTPELVADIARNGIVLTGGGSQLFGMDRLLCERTEMTCVVADDADSCAAYGCGKSLSWMNHMQEGTINLARRRLLKE